MCDMKYTASLLFFLFLQLKKWIEVYFRLLSPVQLRTSWSSPLKIHWKAMQLKMNLSKHFIDFPDSAPNRAPPFLDTSVS